MKISVAIAGKNALPSAFVVWRGFKESIIKAKQMGYDGVELALKSPDEISIKQLIQLTLENNMRISCITTGQVFADKGLCFTSKNPAEIIEIQRIFSGFIDIAAASGCDVNVGRARGFIQNGESKKVADDRFIHNIAPVCEYAGAFGVNIIIEPVNRYEINFINNLDQGAALIKKAGYENLGLMPDVFHMNIEDASITGALKKHRELIQYIHFADSNRLAPGWGHLDFKSIISTLKEINYDGWISIEILPKPEPDTAAKNAIEYLKDLII